MTVTATMIRGPDSRPCFISGSPRDAATWRPIVRSAPSSTVHCIDVTANGFKSPLHLARRTASGKFQHKLRFRAGVLTASPVPMWQSLALTHSQATVRVRAKAVQPCLALPAVPQSRRFGRCVVNSVNTVTADNAGFHYHQCDRVRSLHQYAGAQNSGDHLTISGFPGRRARRTRTGHADIGAEEQRF